MNRRMIGCAYLLTLLSVASGCGEQSAESTVQSDPSRGYSVEYPDTWRPARERMSRISDPRELFRRRSCRSGKVSQAIAGVASLRAP